MDSFFDLYHSLPEKFSPQAFYLGPISVGWYSLMYLAAFITIFWLTRYRIKRGEINLNEKISYNFFLYAFFGLLIGARLGYVLIYNFSRYWQNPLEIISPFDPFTGEFVGIHGLSFHGGLIGIIIIALIYCRINKIRFLALANALAPAVPAGYFFGRIGNFLNGELYGRPTDNLWGMHFPSDPSSLLRHPSALYEAALEGILLFMFLWLFRNSKIKYLLFPLFLVGYSLARFWAEFFREPDAQIGLIWHYFTLGQLLSALMLIAGLFLIIAGRKRQKMLQL